MNEEKSDSHKIKVNSARVGERAAEKSWLVAGADTIQHRTYVSNQDVSICKRIDVIPQMKTGFTTRISNDILQSSERSKKRSNSILL